MRRLWLKLTQMWCWLSNGDGHTWAKSVDLGMAIGGYTNPRIDICVCGQVRYKQK